ncbi:MAG: hypothetical protein H6852_17475 [Geminicoccaceae bacterium]|nr:hypothetical protein [Geminicoccaceae bacterium]HRY27202.1 hypothetical protein [Geminicoccaceae bacterium]
MAEPVRAFAFTRKHRPAAAAGGTPAWPVIAFGTAPADAAKAPDGAGQGLVPVPELVFDEADLARICAAVDEAARQAAREEMARAIEGRTMAALECLASAIDALDAALDARVAELRRTAANLAAATVEALGASSSERVAVRLAETLVDECLGRLDPLLPLTIEVAAELVDPLAAALGRVPGLPARPGRLAIEPARDLAPGEARLVWPDGHAEWSLTELRHRAALILDGLAGDGAPAIAEPNDTREG